MTTTETRFLTEPIELRSEEGTGKKYLEGYAARFNVLSKRLGGGVFERILPGAFTKTLQERDVAAYFNHDQRMLLGRTSAGTLELEEDDIGLHYRIHLTDKTLAGNDATVYAERNEIVGSSFGFLPSAKPTWGKTDRGMPLRSVGEAMLHHISPLIEEPAYGRSDVKLALRSLAEERDLDLETLIAASERDELSELLEERAADENEENGSNEEQEESEEETGRNPSPPQHYRPIV